MSAKAAKPSGELEILRIIRQRAGRIGSPAVRLGIGDDCAILRPRAGEELVVTTDLSLEGRHFRLDWHPPEVVGHRALARGLSDLAAMGARPLAAFLSLAVPAELTIAHGKGISWTTRFLDGLFTLAKAHKVPLAGGDLAQSSHPVADIVLLGTVPKGRALLRSGAMPGDRLYVTGKLGGAAAGLRILAEIHGVVDGVPQEFAEALQPHLYPKPRLGQGRWLRQHLTATAALDMSDGLSTDLAHLCDESGVAAEVDAAALPVSAGATLEDALHGGEDYELLFTAAPSAKLPKSIAGGPVTQIGRIVRRKAGPNASKQAQVTLLTASGPVALEAHGWEHFSTRR